MKKLARYVFFVAGFGILAVISFNPVAANTQAGQPAGAPAMDAESAAQLLPGSSQLINPEDLANLLQSAKSAKPLILNVGPYLLYAQAHIPGAEFIGPTSDSQAMDALLKRVKSLPHNKFVVLYCGCCPWDHCPNVRAAYYALYKAGFTKVKVLYIPNNLGADWVYKGYPTTRG